MKGKRIVVVGSFKNKYGLIKKIREFQQDGNSVFPTEKFIEDAKPLILAHHYDKIPLSKTLLFFLQRREQHYLEHIANCDVVWVLNEKDGEEYVGVATAFEIGYALALDKKILFEREPTDMHMKIHFRRTQG